MHQPDTTASARRTALAFMFGVIAVSSVSFTLIKVVLRDLSPLSLAAGRVVFSACTFTAVVSAQGWRRTPIAPTDRWRVVLCGLGGSAAFHVLYSWGQSRVSVAVSAVVLGAMPALVALGERIFLRHRLTAMQIGGLALSVAGIAIISSGDGGGVSSTAVGIAAVAAATVVWAAVTVGTRSLVGRYDPWWLNAPGTVLGAVIMAALTAPRWREFADLPALSWLYVFWLGAAGSAFIYAGLGRAMKVLPATTAASLNSLVTPISIVIAWSALGERPTRAAVVGAAAVVAGVVLVSTMPGPTTDASADRAQVAGEA
jgi:DME family drug/metabolite transporter